MGKQEEESEATGGNSVQEEGDAQGEQRMVRQEWGKSRVKRGRREFRRVCAGKPGGRLRLTHTGFLAVCVCRASPGRETHTRPYLIGRVCVCLSASRRVGL